MPKIGAIGNRSPQDARIARAKKVRDEFLDPAAWKASQRNPANRWRRWGDSTVVAFLQNDGLWNWLCNAGVAGTEFGEGGFETRDDAIAEAWHTLGEF